MAKYLDSAGLELYDSKMKEHISGLLGGAEKYEYRNANAATLVAGGTTHFNILNVYAQMLDFADMAASYKKFDLVAEITIVKHGDAYSTATAAAKYSIQMQGCNYSAELYTVSCISKVYDRIGIQFGQYPDSYEGTVPIIRVVAPAYSSREISPPGAAFDCYISRVYERTAGFVPGPLFDPENPLREAGAFGAMQASSSPITFGLNGDAVDAVPSWPYTTSET